MRTWRWWIAAALIGAGLPDEVIRCARDPFVTDLIQIAFTAALAIGLVLRRPWARWLAFGAALWAFTSGLDFSIHMRRFFPIPWLGLGLTASVALLLLPRPREVDMRVAAIILIGVAWDRMSSFDLEPIQDWPLALYLVGGAGVLVGRLWGAVALAVVAIRMLDSVASKPHFYWGHWVTPLALVGAAVLAWPRTPRTIVA